MPDIITIIIPVTIAVLTLTGSLVRFIMTRLADRIKALEDETKRKLCKSEARVIIEDKINPLKERLDKMDDKLDKILDIIISGKE